MGRKTEPGTQLGVDVPLKTWRDAAGGAKQGLEVLALLLRKADEAETLLSGAEQRLTDLRREADEASAAVLSLHTQLSGLRESYADKRAALEAEMQAPLESLKAIVAERTAELRAALDQEERLYQDAVSNLQSQRLAAQADLAQHKKRAEEESARLDQIVAEKKAQVQEVTEALNAIKRRIG